MTVKFLLGHTITHPRVYTCAPPPPHVFTRTRRSVWKRSKASGRRQSRRPFSRTERPSRNSGSTTMHRPALRHRGSSAAAPHGVPAPSRRWWAGQEEAAGISCDNGQRGPGCLSLGSSQETLSVWDPGIPDHHSATWREPSPCHSGRDFFRGEAFCPPRPPPHMRTSLGPPLVPRHSDCASAPSQDGRSPQAGTVFSAAPKRSTAQNE